MNLVYKNIFILNNEILYYIFWIIMILIIAFAIIMVYKEVKEMEEK